MNIIPSSPYVEIIEQPTSNGIRFRYECEKRNKSTIYGVNSMPNHKTFPSIRIIGYRGRAKVIVSCVTKDEPYRPHPYNLIGQGTCEHGVYTVEVSSEDMTVTFAEIGIQCVKKKDIEEIFKKREELRIDPFRTGFEHKKNLINIDLNALRLCFQVFLEGTEKGKFNIPLQPVVSDPIFDKKAMPDLVIYELSHSNASVAGGTKMILLCEKVINNDIQVRFFEEKNKQVVWEGFGDFKPVDIYKHTAIVFKTPAYSIQEVTRPVQVYVQLKRPSDGATSKPLPFEMSPFNTGITAITSPQSSVQTLRPKISKEYTPIEYNSYNSVLIPSQSSLQYQSTSNHIVQQPSTGTCAQQSPHKDDISQVQLPKQLMLSRVTQNYNGELQSLNDAAGGVQEVYDTNILNMESRQYNFDLRLNQFDSAEFADFVTAFFEYLSSGLYISDSITLGTNNEQNNTTNNCTSIVGNIQGNKRSNKRRNKLKMLMT